MVQIAQEDALIVWDSRNKTEHFIRRANFQTASKDFGFLVPTPSPPKLGQAPDALFDRLNEQVKPEVKHTRPIRFEPTGFLLGMRKSSSEAAAITASVNVLSEARVAGLDATVLQASDATALGKWLQDHGYSFRKELTAWLEPYVKQKWTITAFKIAKGDAAAEVGTKAVKMSFTAERPFYPYREPEDQRAGSSVPFRMLRVFLISNERVAGELERPGGWPGQASWAGALKDAPSLLSGALGIDEIPPSPVLTALDDRSNPRPGVADVFFTRASDQSELRPPPVVVEDPIVIPIPIELAGLFGCGGVVVLALWLHRRSARAS